MCIRDRMNAALDRIEAVLDEPELPDNGNQHILSQAQPDQPEVQLSLIHISLV